MNNRRGFTLIEAVVAMLVGVIVVVAIGGLGERLIHHRSTTDSNSAALNLAERQLENLLADPVPNPEAEPSNPCPSAALCAGTRAVNLNADGTTTNPSYRVEWSVVNVSGSATSPLVTLPSPPGSRVEAKQITVTVRHLNNPQVHAKLLTYYRMPPE